MPGKGRPFVKGQVANPGGRPKAIVNLRSLLTKKYGEDAGVLVARLEAFSLDRNHKIGLSATELLLAYHAGKPVNHVDVGGEVAPLVLVLNAEPD